MNARRSTGGVAAGVTLVEVMFALLLISLGIMAVARLFPMGSRSQLSSRLQTVAGQYADEELEKLRGLSRTSAPLSIGRHPAFGYDTLGATRSWRRYYVVSAVPAPLDSLLRVDATVQWGAAAQDSVLMTQYLIP